MSFRDKKRDREFQLEILKVELEHEREVVFYSAIMAVGASFTIFAAMFWITILSTGVKPSEIHIIWLAFILENVILGGILLLGGIIFLGRLKSSERNAIEKIRKEYLREW